MQGKYILVEGIDGSGKSTVINDLSKLLTERGIKHLVVQEPGSTALGQQLREIVKHSIDPIDPVTEAMLFAAARRQLWKERVEPALLRGEWVLSDRGLFSSYAYQAGGRGCFDQVLDLAAITFDRAGCIYDLTLVLDLSPSEALKRASDRTKLDRIESCGLEFFEKARDYFHDLWDSTAIACYTRKAVLVDADRSKEAVSADCVKAVEEFLSTTGD